MRLKKHLALAALFLCAGMTFAQQTETPARNAGSEEKAQFNPHWFVQIQGGAAHTRGEAKFKDLLSPAGAVSGGYLFNPLFGLRVGGSGWQAKGGWSSSGIDYKYNYLQGNIDALLDLGNLCCGYSERRVFNPYAFLGVGGTVGFNNDDAVALAGVPNCELRHLWTGRKFFVAGRGGLGVNLRIAKRVAFNIEANANLYSDHFNSKKAGNADWQFNLLAGFTFKIGKVSKKTRSAMPETTPVAEVVTPVEQPVTQPAEQETKARPVVKQHTENVFFLINSVKIRPNESKKIEALAAFLKANPEAKVALTGYADAKTGSKSYNLSIARKRAEAVAAALRESGIAADRITTDSKGDSVQPFSVNEENRVTICVAQ